MQTSKARGGVELQFHLFLTTAPNIGEWPAARSGFIAFGERTAGTTK